MMKRKLIDENGKLFGIVSLIDIIAVIIVIVLGAAVYVRFFTNETTSVAVENDDFTYEIKLTGVRSFTRDAFREGDKVYDAVNGIFLGTIRNVESKDSMIESAIIDGTSVYAPQENRYDVFLTVDSSGLISNGRYYASRRFEINVNEGLEIYTKYCDVNGIIWDIKK